jgi:hypothetical protein
MTIDQQKRWFLLPDSTGWMHRWSAVRSAAPPLFMSLRGCVTSGFSSYSGLSRTPCSVTQRSENALLRVLTVTRPG